MDCLLVHVHRNLASAHELYWHLRLYRPQFLTIFVVVRLDIGWWHSDLDANDIWCFCRTVDSWILGLDGLMNKPIRELRKCLGCPKYFWTVSISTEAGTDNLSERMKYCVDCLNNKLQRPISLKEIEKANEEMDEDDKQEQNLNESVERYRRYKSN